MLDLHPSTLTKAELIREMTGGRPTDTTVDANERAIRELAAAGLLHPVLPEGESVRPTRAAIRFSELQEGA
ncbi:MAG: hypothetical protein E6G51_06510 [Actinobacteria bacterium]|nr:MAG: hypothetical protein E6G51_06510 [Actinomycetota bacterium]